MVVEVDKTRVLQLENNPQYNKLIVNELLYYIITTRKKITPKQLEQSLIEMKKRGLLSPHTLSIYYYLMVNRAATRQKIAEDLETSEPAVYKNIEVLVKENLVKKTGKISAPLHGGHKPQVYAVVDATPSEIAEAKNLEVKRRIPGYQLVDEMTQYMLEDYIPYTRNPHEITYRNLMMEGNRRFNLSNYNRVKIYDLIASNVQRSGVRVWR